MNYKAYLNGKELDVTSCTIFPKPYDSVKEQEFISFTYEEKTELVLCSEEQISSVVIRPKSLNTEYKNTEHEITIQIDKCSNFSVEINGKITENLLVFVRPSRTPAPKYENVIHFEKGVHEIGKLKITTDNTLVYLEEGAFLDGKIEINNCKNVRVMGNGVISERHYSDLPMRICFDVLACEDIFIQDIIITESLFWCMRIFGCKNVEIDNVKVISGRQNNDAFDIVGSKNVIVKNCFTRTWDDSLVVKAFDDKDKTSPHVVFEGSDTDMTAVFEKTGDVENILFKDCVLWNDFARPIEIGVSLRTDKVHNVRYENIDIIHSTTGYPLIGAHHGDRAEVYDFTFENIRVEDTPGAQLFDFRITSSGWNFDTKKGCIHDFYFKNISWTENPKFLPEMSRIEGYSPENNISSFTFENIILCGKTASNTAEMNLSCLDYTDNIKVIADTNHEKINIVKSSVSVPEQLSADENGMYNFDAEIRLENTSKNTVDGKVWLTVSPINVYNSDNVYHYSLKAEESVSYTQKISLPAGKYVLRVQSDSMNLNSGWKLITLDWNIGKDAHQSVSYDFVNYYNLKTKGVTLSCTENKLIIESPVLKNKDNSLILYTAMPAKQCENEILFTVEETDFGEAMAAELGKNGEPVIAPQIRCPAEITYVFKNQPKVEKITVTTVNGGCEKAEYSFKELGIDKNAEEFLIEIQAVTADTKKYRYPYTLFHSVDPCYSAHMFCKVKK